MRKPTPVLTAAPAVRFVKVKTAAGSDQAPAIVLKGGTGHE